MRSEAVTELERTMIRVHVHQDALDSEGGMVIYITGHATSTVCAGVSAVVHTAIDGLKRMAEENPSQLAYNGTLKKKQSTRR
jgi:uncharacterized protein YsxB (DUF464 family)